MKLTRQQLDLTIDSLRQEVVRVSAERQECPKGDVNGEYVLRVRLQQLILTKIKFEKLKIQNELRNGRGSHER